MSFSSADTADVVLEARGFSKSYGAVRAVRGVDFSVVRGTIFGLIGPDGGGKTSLMRSLVSLLAIDDGELFVLGRSVAQDPGFVRRNIGYMPQRFSLYQDLTVEENLRFFSELFAVPKDEYQERIEELFAFSGLEPFRARRAGALSGGMKQKLALSCMLIHSPEVLVLDEPTFGVDPVSRNEFWQILKGLRDRGTSILVSTAYMDEAYHCDRVGLMFAGSLLTVDEPGNLKNQYPATLYLVRTNSPHKVHQALEKSGLCEENHLFGEGVHCTLRDGTRVADLSLMMREAEIQAEEPVEIESGIEDLFLLLMKGAPK